MIEDEKIAEILDEVKAELFPYLDSRLLKVIDTQIFWSRKAKINTVDSGYDYSTYGKLCREHTRVTFTDHIYLYQILNMPTGDTRKTYSSGRGMAATTWGDLIQDWANDWCADWWRDFWSNYSSAVPVSDEDEDIIHEALAESYIIPPEDWYLSLSGTLGELRARCKTDE
jgi:hypothetical protein